MALTIEFFFLIDILVLFFSNLSVVNDDIFVFFFQNLEFFICYLTNLKVVSVFFSDSEKQNGGLGIKILIWSSDDNIYVRREKSED